jgi:hypothetical protein
MLILSSTRQRFFGSERRHFDVVRRYVNIGIRRRNDVV